jgi:hypothetical protein
MHTARFDQHWSSSDVSKIADLSFHKQFYRHLQVTNVGRNMKCGYNSHVEKILKFQSFKVLPSLLIQLLNPIHSR